MTVQNVTSVTDGEAWEPMSVEEKPSSRKATERAGTHTFFQPISYAHTHPREGRARSLAAMRIGWKRWDKARRRQHDPEDAA